MTADAHEVEGEPANGHGIQNLSDRCDVFPSFPGMAWWGEFPADLIACDSVVVDPKKIDGITAHERGQPLNCLRVAVLRTGLNVNFKRTRLDRERVVKGSVFIRC